MNKVEELSKEIKTLQVECLHINTEWIDPPNLKSSLVPRYFVLLNEDTGLSTSFKTRCKDCNLEKGYNALKTCPICFSDMKDDGFIAYGANNTAREIYLGSNYIYYSLRRYVCSNNHCSFKGVADEWDQ